MHNTILSRPTLADKYGEGEIEISDGEGESDLFSREVGRSGVSKVLLRLGVKTRMASPPLKGVMLERERERKTNAK